MKKSAFTLLLLGSLLNPSSGFSQDFTTGLVGYWPFCGCSTKDISGHGHDGTLMNGPVCGTGIRDQDYEFDGSNWINVPYSSEFDMNPNGGMTLAAWVNPANVDGNYHAMVVKGTDVWDYGLYLDVSGTFMFGCQWPNHEVFSTTLPNPGTWYHVVGVYSNRDWKIYVNGIKEDELTNGTTIGRSSNPIGFAIKGNFFKDMYEGSIDEVRLYNRALSDSDVAALYRWTLSGTLSLQSNTSQFAELGCQPAQSTIPFWFEGCGPTACTLDSAWITGSNAFTITSGATTPRQVNVGDSVQVRFASQGIGNDTATLHLRYQTGSVLHDTVVSLFGTGYGGNSQLLHRESASAYFGKIDSLTMAVDISPAINLDSLWPFITDIQCTYTWDSSVVHSYSYVPPSGWSLNSLASHGNSLDFDIQNSASSAMNPMNLGTALFRPSTTSLATSWVELSKFDLVVGTQTISLCVTENEDNHWAVKTLGAPSGVRDAVESLDDISLFPNPADSKLFAHNPNDIAISISLCDAIGRTIGTQIIPSLSTGTIDLSHVANGEYFIVYRINGTVQTRSIVKQ